MKRWLPINSIYSGKGSPGFTRDYLNTITYSYRSIALPREEGVVPEKYLGETVTQKSDGKRKTHLKPPVLPPEPQRLAAPQPFHRLDGLVVVVHDARSQVHGWDLAPSARLHALNQRPLTTSDSYLAPGILREGFAPSHDDIRPRQW